MISEANLVRGISFCTNISFFIHDVSLGDGSIETIAISVNLSTSHFYSRLLIHEYNLLIVLTGCIAAPDLGYRTPITPL